MLHHLTALEQAAAIRAGETTPEELARHHRERIDALNPTLGAFVTVLDEPRWGDRDATGPLSGVPTAIKDLNMTAGVRTTFGSAVYDDFVPDVSDEVTLRIEAAGLPWLGKTSTPEFGSPCYTEPDQGPAVTPWDTTRMAGGSSGGAAAAVAAGLVAVAQGSDGGGSIRIPASCCGIVGLKPSRGRVSGAPMHGEITGLATSGALARTVRDAAAFLDVLAGPAVGDPSWAPAPQGSFLGACDRDPGRLRIARLVDPVIAATEVDPACVRAADDAARLLESLGHDVEVVTVPVADQGVTVFETCWAVLTALSTQGLAPDAPIRPLTRWLAERGDAVTGPQFGLAMGELRRIAARVVQSLASYDAVLSPTLAQLPLPVGALRDDEHPERDFEAQKRFTPWTSLWNITGLPAISLPLHQTPEGLPVGVMLAGRPAGEEGLLALAAQVEAAAPWADRHPPCW